MKAAVTTSIINRVRCERDASRTVGELLGSATEGRMRGNIVRPTEATIPVIASFENSSVETSRPARTPSTAKAIAAKPIGGAMAIQVRAA